MALSLTSPRFQDHGEIPIEYTREGKDISPPLAWSDVPAGARTLALVVEDPDAPDPAAPQRTVVHWVLYNLPPTSGSLPEDVRRHGLPESAHAGMNDHGQAGYSGPQPPIGRHRYFFRLFALDEVLPVDPARPLTRGELDRLMRGHVLDTAELVGTFASKRKGRAA